MTSVIEVTNPTVAVVGETSVSVVGTTTDTIAVVGSAEDRRTVVVTGVGATGAPGSSGLSHNHNPEQVGFHVGPTPPVDTTLVWIETP